MHIVQVWKAVAHLTAIIHMFLAVQDALHAAITHRHNRIFDDSAMPRIRVGA